MVLGWDRRTTGDFLDRAGVDKRYCYLELQLIPQQNLRFRKINFKSCH
jgi:allophanate hydrolase subunit 2